MVCVLKLLRSGEKYFLSFYVFLSKEKLYVADTIKETGGLPVVTITP